MALVFTTLNAVFTVVQVLRHLLFLAAFQAKIAFIAFIITKSKMADSILILIRLFFDFSDLIDLNEQVVGLLPPN